MTKGIIDGDAPVGSEPKVYKTVKEFNERKREVKSEVTLIKFIINEDEIFFEGHAFMKFSSENQLMFIERMRTLLDIAEEKVNAKMIKFNIEK